MKATIVLLLTLASAMAFAGSDREAVERAVLDYVEAVEQGRPEWIERSVHPDLAKFGFYRGKSETEFRVIPMTYDGLVELAGDMRFSTRPPAGD